MIGWLKICKIYEPSDRITDYFEPFIDENEKLESRQNYMTVPAAIREFEKIEMIRGMDRIYRLVMQSQQPRKQYLEHLE